MVQEEYIAVHDLSLCYQKWGENPKIILLHGWLDQCASWDVVCSNLLDAGFSSIAYDHRGHGKSDHIARSAHYHFPDYVHDLLHIHEHLISNAPITLIGHSMGGTVASIYASLFPERVRKLILVEGLGPRDESPQKAKERYKKHLEQRRLLNQHPLFSTREEAAKRLTRHHPYLSFERAFRLACRILIPHNDGWIWRFDPRHKERSAISFSQERHEVILSTIQAPCFLIFGEKSPYLQWIDTGKRSKLIPTHAQTYYIEGGHSPHLSHPDLLSRILIQDCIQG